MGSAGCLLCRCPVPAQCDEVFISHLLEEHRTFSNHKLIFLLSRLDQDGIERTLEFVTEVIRGDIFGDLVQDGENIEKITRGAMDDNVEDSFEEKPEIDSLIITESTKYTIPNDRKGLVPKTESHKEGTVVEEEDGAEKQAGPPPLPLSISSQIRRRGRPVGKTEKCSCPNCVAGGHLVHICRFPDCRRTFRKTTHLKAHLNRHMGVRPYVCPESGCGAAYVRAEELKRHYYVHNREEARYCCPRCD